MEIPSSIAARIGAIEARFTPLTDGAPVSTTSKGPVKDFATVLAASLGTPAAEAATADGPVGQSSIASLIANASASRALAFGPAGAAGGTAGSVATFDPIASKDVVTAIEDRYRNDNGRLPDTALTSLGGAHRLAGPAASAFQQLRATALADGVEIGLTDSYRSYDAQVDVARRKGLYSQGGLAAKPGTSDHGLGLALDLDLDSTALNWMQTNAGRFGFVADTPRESWHWKFDGI